MFLSLMTCAPRGAHLGASGAEPRRQGPGGGSDPGSGRRQISCLETKATVTRHRVRWEKSLDSCVKHREYIIIIGGKHRTRRAGKHFGGSIIFQQDIRRTK